MSAFSPQSVMEDLKQQAERKASLRMWYSAADLLRDYKGPYAQETAAEREKLAAEYHKTAAEAEEARAQGLAAPRPPKPATPPPATRPVIPRQPKPAAPRSSAKPSTPATPKPNTPKTPKAPEYRMDGDQLMFTCRWCKQEVGAPVAEAGKFRPCPKCDELVKVPAPAK